MAVQFRQRAHKRLTCVSEAHIERTKKAGSLGGFITYKRHGVSKKQIQIAIQNIKPYRFKADEPRPESCDFTGKTHKDETKKRIGEKNSIHQSGHKNSQFGTILITDGFSTKKINKDDPIPENWYRGRTLIK